VVVKFLFPMLDHSRYVLYKMIHYPRKPQKPLLILFLALMELHVFAELKLPLY